MGLFSRFVIGRWLVRWLLRGSPAAVVAKLAAVGLFGAWKYRRERRREVAASGAREIPADYEVMGPDRLAEPEPRARGGGTPPSDEPTHRSGID